MGARMAIARQEVALPGDPPLSPRTPFSE